jgi:hypothetical protein
MEGVLWVDDDAEGENDDWLLELPSPGEARKELLSKSRYESMSLPNEFSCEKERDERSRFICSVMLCADSNGAIVLAEEEVVVVVQVLREGMVVDSCSVTESVGRWEVK